MFIGEAPGEAEDEQGVPFVGPSGFEFNKMLKNIKLTREEIFTTNAVMCRPVDDDDKNRKPGKKEIESCRSRLFDEILNVDPDLIILMGDSAVKAVLTDNRKTLESLAGSFQSVYIPCPHGLTGVAKYECYIMYHPSYMMRVDAGWSESGVFRQATDDLRVAVSFVDYLKLLREDPDYALSTASPKLPDRGEDISLRAELRENYET
jgi:uracil-DNA glycosylase family 4